MTKISLGAGFATEIQHYIGKILLLELFFPNIDKNKFLKKFGLVTF